MISEEEMMRPILDDPFDDGPRLVYADWIEERGNPDLAEYIRLAIAAASKGNEYPRCNRRGELWIKTIHPAIPKLPGVEMTEHRRGFVQVVTMSLKVFMGGPCERYQGGNIRTFEMINPGISYRDRQPCPDCSGKGHIPGLAAVVAARWPVTEIRLTDREPLNHGAWFYEVEGSEFYQLDRPTVLPKEFYKFDYLFREYSNAENGRKNLSNACVDYVRELAGLLAIRWSK